MKQLPKISKAAFWDVDLDFHSYTEFIKYKSFIIEKIFDFGTYNDIIEIIRFYGKENIKKEIVNLDLKDKTLTFCCAVFNLKPTDFKCYKKRLLSQTHWNY